MERSSIQRWGLVSQAFTQLKRWAGHESVATLIDTYGHLMPDREAPVLAALDALAASVRSTENREVSEILRTG